MTHCPICGCKGEDLVFIFICSSSTCQNYRKDLQQTVFDQSEEKENNNSSYSWPVYNDDD